MISRGAQRVTIEVDLHVGPDLSVQFLDEGGNEAGRVIFGQEVIEGWRQQLSLLPVHWP